MQNEVTIDQDAEKTKSHFLSLSTDKNVDLSYIDEMIKTLSPRTPVVYLDGGASYRGNSPYPSLLNGAILGYMFYSDANGQSYCGTTACFVSSQHYNLNGFTLECDPSQGWQCCTFTKK